MKTKQLPQGWKEVELKEIGQIITGGTPPRVDGENYGNKTPWIKPPNLDNSMYVSESTEYLSDIGTQKSRLLPAGSVLVSCIGNIGKTAISKCSLTTNQQINSIVPNQNVSPEFLYYNIRKHKKKLEFASTKAIVPLLNKTGFSKIKIPLPSLPTQKAIVQILEKAEKLKQQREQADKLTSDYLKSIFNEMFLKEEFKSVKMGDLFEIVRGGSPRPIQDFLTDNKEGFNWIKIGDTKDHPKYITKTKEKIKQEGLKKTRLVNKGDFLLSNSMSFGRPYILKIKGCIHDGWLAIIDKDKKVNQDYLYEILCSEFVNIQFIGSASGSTVKNLNIEIVKKVKIPLPPLSLQKKFASIVEHIEKLKEKQKQSSEEINNLFNVLMQKAFKGELV